MALFKPSGNLKNIYAKRQKLETLRQETRKDLTLQMFSK